MIKQDQLIQAYFDYVGTARENITAIENSEEVIFIITYSKTNLLNLKPKTDIYEIKIFFNAARIIFKKQTNTSTNDGN